MINLTCPVCFRDIERERILQQKAYCSCGHVCNITPNAAKPEKSMGIASLVIFAALFLSTAIHIVNWDSYFFTIIPLKVKQLLSVAKTQDLRQIAEICNARKKASCEVEALKMAFDLNHATELEGLVRAGNILMDQKQYASAAQTYATYFHNKGKNIDARYEYAKALSEIGLNSDAKKQYSYILKLPSREAKYQVARSYVQLLIKERDYSTAKRIIEKFRHHGSSSGLFLDKELKLIDRELSSSNQVRRFAKGA